MKKSLFGVLTTCCVFFTFSTTTTGKVITFQNKPLECTVTSGSGSGLSATAETCEDAFDLLDLMEEVYWE